MKTIKQVLFVVVMTLLLVSPALAQEPAGKGSMLGPTTVSQAMFPIKVQGADYDLITQILDFPSGSGVATHFHGGPVLVTVLSGEMTLQEKNTERVLKIGQSWTENPGDQHAVVNAGSVTTRVAVSMLLPKGAKDTTLVK
jgi:quercetin dioxygenase-like cupin family protein